MSNSTETWTERYLRQMVGVTVLDVTFEPDEYSRDLWATLHVSHPTHGKLLLEISRDEEGNGPGFIFGLPEPS